MNFTTESNSNYISHFPLLQTNQREGAGGGGHSTQPIDAMRVQLVQSTDPALQNEDNKYEPPKIKPQQLRCNLKLEGDQSYSPEYRSQYIEYPIEKCYSIPQLSSIKFQGDFTGIAEYKDQYRTYDIFSKSAPMKKPDTVNLLGYNESTPEYQERYKQYTKNEFNRTFPIIRNDTLVMDGQFTKILPEYNESFKNPNVTTVPEKAKCRQTYFTLKGPTDFNPEYKCTYLDFPRARPITKKPISSIKFIQPNIRPLESEDDELISQHKQQTTAPVRQKIHHPTAEEEKFMCQPEVRKAKMELMKKEWTKPKETVYYSHVRERPELRELTTTTTDSSSSIEFLQNANLRRQKSKDSAPSFKLMVENVDDTGGSFKQTKLSPKFGRRSSIKGGGGGGVLNTEVNGNNTFTTRNRTKVIEGNKNYYKKGNMTPTINTTIDENHNSPSFVVLNEPCKENVWMKSSWYAT